MELTEYLLRHKYWMPPKVRLAFDVLPLVLKVPCQKKPYVYELPREYIFKVRIEHPSKPEITNLGYWWMTVPAIADFEICLGRIWYQNFSFNGRFMSTEIICNLME